MISPRRIALLSNKIKIAGLSTDPPPPNALFWRLWHGCAAIADQALETNFIQGIASGRLDPIKYGAFNVLDAYYCYNGAGSYLAAESRAEHPTLKAFLLEKYNSYQKYNEAFTQIWHIRDANGVIPNNVSKNYVQFEADVASHQDPIYCLIVMIPCEYLWYWLSDKLYPPASNNLYSFWINENHYPDGAYAMGNFLESYRAEYPIDDDKALEVYSKATTYEQQNFAAAA
jgi:thiaminase/transcriptional activator TenA